MKPSTSFTIKNMSPLLLVSNIEHSIRFYRDQLNFTVDFRYEDFYAGIIKDGFSIHLKANDASRPKRKPKRNNGDIDITFSVTGIQGLYEQLSDKSLHIVQPLRKMPYGKEFYIADPDGNIMSFLEVE